jgi:hypothetical protein
MSTRMDFVARLPWVTRLEVTQDCDGYRWAHMPGKALRDPAVMATYKCRNRARWRFRGLAPSQRNPFPAQGGTYCWPHLWSLGLQRNMAEEARTRRGLAKMVSTDEWNALPSVSSGRLARS